MLLNYNPTVNKFYLILSETFLVHAPRAMHARVGNLLNTLIIADYLRYLQLQFRLEEGSDSSYATYGLHDL